MELYLEILARKIADDWGQNHVQFDPKDFVDIEDIKPARLTPEILEKNGWMLYHLYYWFVEKECLKLRLLEFDNYTWNACIGDNVIRINMCSVSDLQHLLFGLGLKSEMEV